MLFAVIKPVLIELAFMKFTKNVLTVIEEVVRELIIAVLNRADNAVSDPVLIEDANIWYVEKLLGYKFVLDRYPIVPRPVTVDWTCNEKSALVAIGTPFK